jgi:hypothetical protein
MDELTTTPVKRCARCKTDKSLDEFKIKDGKPYCWCILCTREYLRNKMREYRQNPGVARPRNREYLTLPPATEILALVNAVGVSKAAEQLGCHTMTVISRLKKASLYRGFARRTRVSVKPETLFDLYFNQSKSFNEIRKEYGCTMWHLQDTFSKQGWTPRPRGRRPKIKSESIKEKSDNLFNWS